ncbi:hypothetical protein LCGC14_2532510, partial [marine sediment metagenome]
ISEHLENSFRVQFVKSVTDEKNCKEDIYKYKNSLYLIRTETQPTGSAPGDNNHIKSIPYIINDDGTKKQVLEFCHNAHDTYIFEYHHKFAVWCFNHYVKFQLNEKSFTEENMEWFKYPETIFPEMFPGYKEAIYNVLNSR